jgi:hypothetical protein
MKSSNTSPYYTSPILRPLAGLCTTALAPCSETQASNANTHPTITYLSSENAKVEAKVRTKLIRTVCTTKGLYKAGAPTIF